MGHCGVASVGLLQVDGPFVNLSHCRKESKAIAGDCCTGD